MKYLSGLVFAALLMPTSPALTGERGVPAGEFDFYVLSLSWSPSYCATQGSDSGGQQCNGPRPYAFIVHGLWPQYEAGYPEYCASRQPERVPNDLVGQYLDIIPSAGLMGHQWRKHGVCSGLSQTDYFAMARKARDRVKIPSEYAQLEKPLMVAPEDVEQSFLEVNPGLEKAGMAVTCGRRYLREVRICMTKELTFRSCKAVDSADCRRDRALMPPAREQ